MYLGGFLMPVARGDEGMGHVSRKRIVRKGPEQQTPSSTPNLTTSPSTQSQAQPAPRTDKGTRLDDLYRLTMAQLFALAEKEGISEHTGMTRVQLIVQIVRRKIERGEMVRGVGTLEVLPDGYGFLRSAAHNYLFPPAR
jgi:transcription termination factor Rho